MSSVKRKGHLKKIKTGRLERRFSLASTGVVAGSRLATDLWASLLVPKSKRQAHRNKAMVKQANYLATELGKLKGSVVKVGQMMALYGEHVLSPEVISALRTLEEHTIAVDWPVIEQVLQQTLPASTLAQLDIDSDCLAAASLGQVHRATFHSDALCLKVQYPGVAESIDSDLLDVVMLLKMAKLVSFEHDIDDLVEEVRQILHREVDYKLEAQTTMAMHDRLQKDSRFVVPKVYQEFCSEQVLAMSYEEGVAVNDESVAALSQARRNELGRAFLDLFFMELFSWSTMQSDPNFGNYRICLASNSDKQDDKIVLLDFGAVITYPASFIDPLRQMLLGAVAVNLDEVIEGAIRMGMLETGFPDETKHAFAKVCIALVEPLSQDMSAVPAQVLNTQGEYCWSNSDLPKRVAKLMGKTILSGHFRVPPKEFTFMSRKLLGVYSLIETLGSEFNGWPVLAPYLEGKSVE